MEAFKFAFETLIVGVLAFPCLALTFLLLFPNGLNPEGYALAVLKHVPGKLRSQCTFARKVVSVGPPARCQRSSSRK